MKPYLLIATILVSSFIKAQDFSTLKKKDFFDVSGSIGTNLSFSDYGSGRGQQSPWAYTVSSALNFRVAGISVPLSFAYANGDRSFTHPFVRFGLSPKYKNIRAHLGYRSMNLSPSIFSGKTFLGAGTEMSFGLFRFSGFYGTIEGSRVYDEKGYSSKFDRTAYGVKIGVGNNKYFLDIVAFKAKDDAKDSKFALETSTEGAISNSSFVSSAKYKNYERKSYPINNSAAFSQYLHRSRLSKYGSFYAADDEDTPTTVGNAIYPEDNMVVGANAGFTLFNRVTVRSLFSFSGYTSNSNGKEVEDVDLGIISSLLEARANSRTGYASNTSVSAQFSYFGLSVNHRMVSNDYKTLGIENMATNFTTTSLNANSTLLQGKLNWSGFYSIYANNFNNQQLYTSKRNSYGINLSSTITNRLSVSANYNGLRSYQDNGTEVVEEATKLDMSTHSVNISPNYNINSDKLGHNISLNFDYSTTVNNNKKTEYVQDSKNMLLSSSYSLNWIPLQLSTGLNYSFNKSWISSTTDGGHSIGVFANKTFLEKKNLSVNASLNYGATAYEQEVAESGTVKTIVNNQNSFTISGGARYSLFKSHHFSTNYTWSSSSYSGESSRNTFRASISYSYTLPTLSKIFKKDKK